MSAREKPGRSALTVSFSSGRLILASAQLGGRNLSCNSFRRRDTLPSDNGEIATGLGRCNVAGSRGIVVGGPFFRYGPHPLRDTHSRGPGPVAPALWQFIARMEPGGSRVGAAR